MIRVLTLMKGDEVIEMGEEGANDLLLVFTRRDFPPVATYLIKGDVFYCPTMR